MPYLPLSSNLWQKRWGGRGCLHEHLRDVFVLEKSPRVVVVSQSEEAGQVFDEIVAIVDVAGVMNDQQNSESLLQLLMTSKKRASVPIWSRNTLLR